MTMSEYELLCVYTAVLLLWGDDLSEMLRSLVWSAPRHVMWCHVSNYGNCSSGRAMPVQYLFVYFVMFEALNWCSVQTVVHFSDWDTQVKREFIHLMPLQQQWLYCDQKKTLCFICASCAAFSCDFHCIMQFKKKHVVINTKMCIKRIYSLVFLFFF